MTEPSALTAAEAAHEGPPIGITPPRRRGGAGRSLPDMLVELGFVSPERMAAAVEQARTAGHTAERVLLDAGELAPDQYARALAERSGLDHVDLTVFKVDLSATNLISPQKARRYEAVPIGYDHSGMLLVAMARPGNVLALDDLKLLTGREVQPLVASAEDIAGLIGRMNRLDDAVAEAVEDQDEEDIAVVSDIRESADDAPVIKLVNSIIAQAAQDGASDIHFEPADGREMRVRFRVDGVLSEITTIPRRMVPGVVSRVKIMGDLDIAERRMPQDGRVGLTVEGRAVDIRIVTIPTVHGEGVVLRLLDKDSALISLDALGMRDGSRDRFEAATRAPFGCVLVTGPTGSGKSTTLYAALNAINSIERHIMTVEDPVEYQLPGLTQIQVNPRSGLTFARGLRSMLRADPDVIMVGEIRDAETARIAVESALTGHLVLSTLHTNDAPSAITRLTEMGIEPFLTASAVDCVVAQRLARTLCQHCRRATTLSPHALETAGFPAHEEVHAFEPGGCARCGGTGYRGRTGLFEVMTVTDEIRSLAIERNSADAIRNVAMEQGMTLLRADGLEKVRLGLTSIAEVARVA